MQWRIIGGEKAIEGRVEVNYQGKWGSVCGDEMWSLVDASVFCKSLGLPKATMALRHQEFGQKADSVWLNRLMCAGDEASLADCPHGGWGEKKSSCYYPANVVCGKPKGKNP